MQRSRFVRELDIGRMHGEDLKKNKVALVAGIILLVLIFFIIFGPAISGYGYEKIDANAINQGPSAHSLVRNR